MRSSHIVLTNLLFAWEGLTFKNLMFPPIFKQMSDMWKKKVGTGHLQFIDLLFHSIFKLMSDVEKKNWEWLSSSLEISCFLPFLNGWVTFGNKVVKQLEKGQQLL